MLPAATRLLDAATPCDQLVELQPIGGKLHRVDDDLDEIVARALKRALENAGHLLDTVAQLPRGGRQHALGHVAGKRHDEDGEFRDVDLGHRRLLGRLRQVGLGVLHLAAGVLQRRRQIDGRLELDQHVAAALESGRTHFLEALQAFQLGFHRPQQQPL